MILNGYSNYLISQFDRICAENNIILSYISLYLSHLFQLLDIGYFAVLKYIYSHFINNLTRTGYNYINKLDFLVDYLYTKIEAFQPNIVQNSFAATDIILIDIYQIFSKFNILLQIFLLLSNRSNNRSNQFISKIFRTIVQLQKQTKIIKIPIDRQSKNSPNLLKLIVDEIFKDHYQILYYTMLLVKKSINLYTINNKIYQKYFDGLDRLYTKKIYQLNKVYS